MELYILDSLLRRNKVVDKFESLIWTERWHDIGDFELELKSTLESRNSFVNGAKLAINNSYRVMTVESVEDTTDSEGKQVLKVRGRSLESILEDRIAKYSMSNLTTEPVWVLTGTPKTIMNTMFDHICRAPGALSTNDVIPFLQPGSIFPPSNITKADPVIDWEQRPEPLYNAIHTLAGMYDLGFRLVRNFDTSQLYFDVYDGNYRTTQQTELTPVIFSPSLDNIQDTTEFTSVHQSKNVAYVFSEVGTRIVFGDNVDPDISGFDRRILRVTPSIDADHPDPDSAMEQAGLEALREHRAVSLFEGEVNEYNKYVYGVDYDLGDLVEMRNQDGVVSNKRVTEQIFVADAQGERSYPTLTSLDPYGGENSWASWINKSTVWEEFTTEHWADM